MVMAETTKEHGRKNIEPITGWVSRRLGLKQRCRRIHSVDHRMSESRIVEDALLMYLPLLEQRYGNYQPVQEAPPDTQH